MNQTFDRLKVISYERYNGRVYFNCSCKCGGFKKALSSNVIAGKTKSCGCLQKEQAQKSNSKRNIYDLSGEYGIGYTSKGEEFYFDLDDYDKIKDYCWSARHGYLRARDPNTNKDIIMHRLIMNVNETDNAIVDHIKHNTLDNRKSQLRVCSPKENSRNKELLKSNKSGYPGVYKYNNKWTAKIMVNRKSISLGTYKSFENALKARKEAEDKYFGDFSYRASMK